MLNLKYLSKTAGKNEIYTHLMLSNELFIPKLSSRVNLEEYSTKIQEKAFTFEAWNNEQLIGLIAIYFNNEKKSGFITNVSVLDSHRALGIASELMNRCIYYARKNFYLEIKLEVDKDNNRAINFYKKHNFKEIENINNTLVMKLEIKNN